MGLWPLSQTATGANLNGHCGSHCGLLGETKLM
jgi:hypothetical protein